VTEAPVPPKPFDPNRLTEDEAYKELQEMVTPPMFLAFRPMGRAIAQYGPWIIIVLLIANFFVSHGAQP
jgi:hypothetical protein